MLAKILASQCRNGPWMTTGRQSGRKYTEPEMLAETNRVLDAMIRNQWMFPTTECIHILAFAVSIGTIAVVDLSLLNLGFDGKAAAVIYQSVEPGPFSAWFWLSFPASSSLLPTPTTII